MYKIEIYEDKKGHSEIAELLERLNNSAKTDKHSRIRLKKITEYIEILKTYGLQVGYPVVKHISNTELWELRPTSDRIFFIYQGTDTFVLLHHFVKKTQKTPRKEIEKAQRNLYEYLEREVCKDDKKLG